MTDFQITCNYELNPLLREYLGARLSIVSGKDFTVSICSPLTCSGFGELRFFAYFEREEVFLSVQFVSKGDESYAGNLYGLEVIKFEKGDRKRFISQENHPARVMSDFGAIKKIVGLGEVRDEIIVVEGREDELKWFFPANSLLPDTIMIKKKTLEVIGFGLDTGKWLYLFSEGEGHFRIEFEMTLPPEELCARWDYTAMEKNLQILEVFE